MNVLIADSGSTKCEWCLLFEGRKKKVFTQGLSPYFLKTEQMQEVLQNELIPAVAKRPVDELYFYGTGCYEAAPRKIVFKALKAAFPSARIRVDHDLTGAAHALCGNSRGIACILGTGSNSGYFDGRRIARSTPGLGYILGDEGSGAYLGKKTLQYYLYNTFDEELKYKFDVKYATNRAEILENVYKAALPNRYLASFAIFLAENRGHYMVENIIEDGFNDFFFNHLYKYRETWRFPIHFVGSIAHGFRDVLKEMSAGYELELGNILKTPMEGLIAYHNS